MFRFVRESTSSCKRKKPNLKVNDLKAACKLLDLLKNMQVLARYLPDSQRDFF